MSESINVNFKVSGGELANYIQQIQSKSNALTNSAIKGAIAQNEAGKANLKIIDDQIKAIERKTRIETQAARSIALERRESDLKKSRDVYEGRVNDVFSNGNLSEDQKKEKITALRGSQLENEQSIKGQYRENITNINEQGRQSKIQTQLAKENLDALKDTAAKNVKAIQSGDLKLVDVIRSAQTDEQKLVARITEESLNDDKHELKEKMSPKRESFFNDIIKAENFNKVFELGTRAANSKNGYDMISSVISAIPNAIATVADGIPIVGGLTKVGAKAADAMGQFLERKAIAGQELLANQFKYNAVTGSDSGISYNIDAAGVGATDFLKYRTEMARRRGYGFESNETARDAIYAEKGFGVEQSTSYALIEMQRSSRENNRDLAGLIGGIIEKGRGDIFKNSDNSFLNEFLGKFTTLQKELLKTSTIVHTGTTMDILSRFNKVGGEFDIRDSRGMGNINAIQQGLSSPSSDNMKAMAYRILSKENPSMGMFDLTEEMSKGLGSPGYMKGVLSMIEQIGGNDQTQMMNLSGVFKQLSPSAVRRLFENRKGLMSGSISTEELQSKFSIDFQGKAESNTTRMESGTAEIQTALVTGTVEAILKIGETTKEAILDAFSGAVLKVDNGKGTIEFQRPAQYQNRSRTLGSVLGDAIKVLPKSK